MVQIAGVEGQEQEQEKIGEALWVFGLGPLGLFQGRGARFDSGWHLHNANPVPASWRP